MIPSHRPTGHCSTAIIRAVFGLCLAALSCSGTQPTVLICKDASGRSVDQSWILKVNAPERTAEMVVHVPAESIAAGTPAGNRRGAAVIGERAYDITIPSDAGGSGNQSGLRLQFQFEIDRYTGLGTLWIGEEKHGETGDHEAPLRIGASFASPLERPLRADWRRATIQRAAGLPLQVQATVL